MIKTIWPPTQFDWHFELTWHNIQNSPFQNIYFHTSNKHVNWPHKPECCHPDVLGCCGSCCWGGAYRRLHLEMTCWQLGQRWITSLQPSMQKGMKQHPRSHLYTHTSHLAWWGTETHHSQTCQVTQCFNRVAQMWHYHHSVKYSQHTFLFNLRGTKYCYSYTD